MPEFVIEATELTGSPTDSAIDYETDLTTDAVSGGASDGAHVGSEKVPTDQTDPMDPMDPTDPHPVQFRWKASLGDDVRRELPPALLSASSHSVDAVARFARALAGLRRNWADDLAKSHTVVPSVNDRWVHPPAPTFCYLNHRHANIA